MRRDFSNKGFLIISVLIFSFTSFSQKATVNATIDKNRIVIGEQILLTLQTSIPENESIRFFEIDSIPHFEFIERQKIDTVNTDAGTELKQNFRITSFDSGSFVIPSFILPGNKTLNTDSIPVEVGFAAFDRDKDYNDIKDIIEVKPVEKKDWQWKVVVGAAILLLAVVLTIYFLKRKRKPETAGKILINAYQEAMQQLEQLKKENPAAKIFFTRLIQIFREYIFYKKGIQSMHQTTDDLIVQLKSLNMSPGDYNQLSQVLALSDFVKFAKYEPAEKDKSESFNTMKQSIDIIQNLPSRPNPVGNDLAGGNSGGS